MVLTLAVYLATCCVSHRFQSLHAASCVYIFRSVSVETENYVVIATQLYTLSLFFLQRFADGILSSTAERCKSRSVRVECASGRASVRATRPPAHFFIHKIPPQRSVGAGRASGALALELVTFAKTSSSHIALPGGGPAGPQGRAF